MHYSVALAVCPFVTLVVCPFVTLVVCPFVTLVVWLCDKLFNFD